jgi:MFS transporter, Spinster family, sphingosine-1-phosphate transporter
MARLLPSPRTALAVLTGLNFLNYLDRFLPFAVLPALSASLHLSDTRAGLLQTLFMGSYMLVSPVAGWLGDRRGRFGIAAVGVLIWSVATFGSGLAPGFLALAIARALTGVGEASYVVVTPSLLSDYYPAERRGRALAIFYAAIPIGTAAAYAVGGQVEAHFGWRAAFLIVGGPGALLAFTLAAFRDPPRGRFDAKITQPEPTTREALRQLWARPSFIYNTAAQILFTFCTGGLAAWMPTYYHRARHLSNADATLKFGALLLVAGFVGTLAGGRAGDRLARRRPDGHFLVSAVTLIATLPFTLLAILHPSPAIFWPAMFVTLLFTFVNTGPLNAAMANVLPPQLRGRGFGVNVLAIHLFGDMVSPTAIGVVSDHIGLATPVLVTAMLLAVAGLVLLAGRASLRRDLHAAAAVPA